MTELINCLMNIPREKIFFCSRHTTRCNHQGVHHHVVDCDIYGTDPSRCLYIHRFLPS
jgi:hypothetical protein